MKRPLLTAAGWVVAAILTVPPLLGLIYASLQGPADPYAEVAIRWDRALSAAGRSLLLSAGVMLGAGLLGGFLGWGQARWRGVRGAGLLASLPLVVPSFVLAAAMGRLWAVVFGRPPEGLVAAGVVLTLATTPLVQFTVAAALHDASAAEEEAARSLGATDRMVFWAVLWPRLRPAMALSALLAALYAISDFGVVAMLDVPVLTWRMYEAVARQELARAAVLGGLAFASIVPLAGLAWWVRGAQPQVGVANVRRREPVSVGVGWKVVYWAVASTVGGLGALLPVGVLVTWVWEGLERGLQFAPLWEPLADTLLVATGGALVLVGLALMPALAAGGRALEGFVYATSVLPAVLMAFGWLGVGLGVGSLRHGLYASLMASGLLLVLAYGGRFLAEVHAPIRSSALGLDPRQEASVAMLGGSPWDWFRRVALPGIRPGLKTGLLLGGVVLAKELPIALLLGTPTGLKTLAFRLWDRYGEALWHDAGAAGLCLIALGVVGRIGLVWVQPDKESSGG